MRNAFASEITELAKKNERIVLLSADIGNRLFDPYKELFPNRFINCGIAEANMTGMAAGMALTGLIPFTYTITPFNTYRCLEQIRVDLCYQNLPVTIVGVGSGLSYASLGATHHSCEDISVLRSLPNMTIICPSDAIEVRCALRSCVTYDKPAYIRLGKKNEPLVHNDEPHFEIGKGIIIRPGEKICLLATGTILPAASKIADFLKQNRINAQLVSLHTIKPLDDILLTTITNEFPLIITIEEHSLIGGLGSAISEWISDYSETEVRLCRFGTPDKFLKESGNQENARNMARINWESIGNRILNEWNRIN